MRLLLVEDDLAIARPLADALGRYSFEVTHVTTGEAAVAHAADAELVLLDLGLPDLDGTEVCRRIRERSSVPVIMVTARDDELDRVMGLELGADDYVVKPFGLRELIARIRAVSRRAAAAQTTEPVASDAPQEIGPLTLDRRTRRVHLDGHPVELTAKEFDLLSFLADDPGAVRTRADIVTTVWDAHWYGPTKTVDVHVAAIRRKLGDARWIEAVRGVGFRFDAPPDPALPDGAVHGDDTGTHGDTGAARDADGSPAP